MSSLKIKILFGSELWAEEYYLVALLFSYFSLKFSRSYHPEDNAFFLDFVDGSNCFKNTFAWIQATNKQEVQRGARIFQVSFF